MPGRRLSRPAIRFHAWQGPYSLKFTKVSLWRSCAMQKKSGNPFAVIFTDIDDILKTRESIYILGNFQSPHPSNSSCKFKTETHKGSQIWNLTTCNIRNISSPLNFKRKTKNCQDRKHPWKTGNKIHLQNTGFI